MAENTFNMYEEDFLEAEEAKKKLKEMTESRDYWKEQYDFVMEQWLKDREKLTAIIETITKSN